jgi:hypothetical protein
MTPTDDLRRTIEAHLDQLEREAVALHAALEALGEAGTDADGSSRSAPDGAASRGGAAQRDGTAARHGAAPRDGAVRPDSDPRRRRRSPRTRRGHRAAPTEAVPAAKLLALLGGGGPLSTTELSERAEGDRGQVFGLLRELEDGGHVRRSGERRSTRWHLVTDEDRIARRAAELEAVSRGGTAAGTPTPDGAEPDPRG